MKVNMIPRDSEQSGQYERSSITKNVRIGICVSTQTAWAFRPETRPKMQNSMERTNIKNSTTKMGWMVPYPEGRGVEQHRRLEQSEHC